MIARKDSVYLVSRSARFGIAVISCGERSLRLALSEYVEHFHAERNHQGKGNVLLFPRDTDIRRAGPVQCRERLGGLLRYYHQEAA
jgi:putative transposase